MALTGDSADGKADTNRMHAKHSLGRFGLALSQLLGRGDRDRRNRPIGLGAVGCRQSLPRLDFLVLNTCQPSLANRLFVVDAKHPGKVFELNGEYFLITIDYFATLPIRSTRYREMISQLLPPGCHWAVKPPRLLNLMSGSSRIGLSEIRRNDFAQRTIYPSASLRSIGDRSLFVTPP